MTLDAKLRWKPHVKNKLMELNQKYLQMCWLIGRYSSLSIKCKLLIYQQILKPVWMYGCQLWGCASVSTINKIQVIQNKILRNIIQVPNYYPTKNLHDELEMPLVNTVIQQMSSAHFNRLRVHPNQEAVHLLSVECLHRRLKRIKPHELEKT